jgi:hypothetical protein
MKEILKRRMQHIWGVHFDMANRQLENYQKKTLKNSDAIDAG